MSPPLLPTPTPPTNNLFLGALLKVAKVAGAQILNMVKITLILFHHNPLFFYTIGLKNFWRDIFLIGIESMNINFSWKWSWMKIWILYTNFLHDTNFTNTTTGFQNWHKWRNPRFAKFIIFSIWFWITTLFPRTKHSVMQQPGVSWVINGWWHWFGSVIYGRLFWFSLNQHSAAQ